MCVLALIPYCKLMMNVCPHLLKTKVHLLVLLTVALRGIVYATPIACLRLNPHFVGEQVVSIVVHNFLLFMFSYTSKGLSEGNKLSFWSISFPTLNLMVCKLESCFFSHFQMSWVV